MEFRLAWLSLLVVLAVCSCGARQESADTARRKKLGAITGLVRYEETASMIEGVDIAVAGRKTTSSPYYTIDDLPPGMYSLQATFGGKSVTINKIDVAPGLATYVDVWFKANDPAPAVIEWGDPRASEIRRFQSEVARIEGTVGDVATRARVAGAVVTAARGRDDETLQTITDDHGRFAFDHVPTGTYAISAYYSVSGRAQIEVRRSDVTVNDGEGVLVPLWIELPKTN